MSGYIIRRLLQSLIVILLVTIMVFLLVRLLPGDPILVYVSRDQLSGAVAQETIDALRHEYGLDRSLWRSWNLRTIWRYIQLLATGRRWRGSCGTPNQDR